MNNEMSPGYRPAFLSAETVIRYLTRLGVGQAVADYAVQDARLNPGNPAAGILDDIQVTYDPETVTYDVRPRP